MNHPLGKIVIYTRIACPKSMKAKTALTNAQLAYTEVSIDTNPECLQSLIDYSDGDSTIPQIYFNDLRIDYEELHDIVKHEQKWSEIVNHKSDNEFLGPPLPQEYTISDYHYSEVHDDLLSNQPDDYSTLIKEMKKANVIRDNRIGMLTLYKNSFKGSDLLDWMEKHEGMDERSEPGSPTPDLWKVDSLDGVDNDHDNYGTTFIYSYNDEFPFDRKEALELGQNFLDFNICQQTTREIGTSFNPERYYQLIDDDDSRPLNYGIVEGPFLTPSEYNHRLVDIIEDVYKDILHENRRTILYHKLSESSNYSRYLQYIKELHRVDLSLSSPDERMILLVNIYNMMFIHIVHKNGAPQNVWQRRKYMNCTYYQIKEHKYALHSILNGVLRSNRKGLGMLWKSFGKQDERLPLTLPECNPIVLLALTSGTKSTPPLRVYHVKDGKQQMKQNAIDFLKDDENLKVDCKKNTIYLSKIFKWYHEDFGGSAEKVVRWILDIFKDTEVEKIKIIRKLFYSGTYVIDYLPYDWTFNGN